MKTKNSDSFDVAPHTQSFDDYWRDIDRKKQLRSKTRELQSPIIVSILEKRGAQNIIVDQYKLRYSFTYEGAEVRLIAYVDGAYTGYLSYEVIFPRKGRKKPIMRRGAIKDKVATEEEETTFMQKVHEILNLIKGGPKTEDDWPTFFW